MKKLFITLCLAVALTFGYAATSVDQTVLASNGYPQMQTQEQIEFFAANDCTILGAYESSVVPAWIMWGKCITSVEPCEAFIATPNGVIEFKSCGAGYEGYRIMCEKAGDCL